MRAFLGEPRQSPSEALFTQEWPELEKKPRRLGRGFVQLWRMSPVNAGKTGDCTAVMDNLFQRRTNKYPFMGRLSWRPLSFWVAPFGYVRFRRFNAAYLGGKRHGMVSPKHIDSGHSNSQLGDRCGRSYRDLYRLPPRAINQILAAGWPRSFSAAGNQPRRPRPAMPELQRHRQRLVAHGGIGGSLR